MIEKIISGGSEYTEKWVIKDEKPMLHIDLSSIAPFNPTALINDWIVD